jgi:HAD superfamily hydrolase (TIGR01450 family)
MSAATLRGSTEPLTAGYDVALLDLDGVVYVGADEVPGAAEVLDQVRRQGMRLAFVTNNAARTPSAVADHLTRLGIPADPAEVITSAQAAAHHLSDRLPPGARVLVVGTTGLREALVERGLVPVCKADAEPAAVVQGYSPDTDWHMLAEGAIAIRRGMPWIATNLDATVPSSRGPLPGNGSLVAALERATGRSPVSTGKPDPTMHRESVGRSGAKRPLIVGDRLDTDIEGANAVGCDSMLVLSGVTSAEELLAAPPNMRSDYLAADLSGLLTAHPAPVEGAEGVRCGGWSARRDTRRVMLARTAGDGGGDRLDALRALCAAVWSTGLTRYAPADAAAEAAFAELGLDRARTAT